jgi:hypothetical protein
MRSPLHASPSGWEPEKRKDLDGREGRTGLEGGRLGVGTLALKRLQTLLWAQNFPPTSAWAGSFLPGLEFFCLGVWFWSQAHCEEPAVRNIPETNPKEAGWITEISC